MTIRREHRGAQQPLLCFSRWETQGLTTTCIYSYKESGRLEDKWWIDETERRRRDKKTFAPAGSFLQNYRCTVCVCNTISLTKRSLIRDGMRERKKKHKARLQKNLRHCHLMTRDDKVIAKKTKTKVGWQCALTGDGGSHAAMRHDMASWPVVSVPQEERLIALHLQNDGDRERETRLERFAFVSGMKESKIFSWELCVYLPLGRRRNVVRNSKDLRPQRNPWLERRDWGEEITDDGPQRENPSTFFFSDRRVRWIERSPNVEFSSLSPPFY